MNSTDSGATRLSLISRIRVDDSRAWRELVELYGPLIAYWCRKQGLSDSATSDCVQDVFFAVLKSFDQYQPRTNGGGFRAWLWMITRNKIIDTRRVTERQALASGGSSAQRQFNQIPDANLSEDDPTEPIELNKVLHRAMDQVRDEFESKTWQAFWRTTIDGISTAVVAEELSLTPATIRQHRSRILRRLRRQLGDMI